MRTGRTLLASIMGGVIAALAAIGPAAAGEPLKIRAGYVVVPASMMPVLFIKKDILKHYGQSYTVETIHFSSTSPEVTALATGDLDIASLAFSSFGAAVLNARLDDLRIVADGFQDGYEGYFSGAYLVRKDSAIKTVDDLKGKLVASNGIGGATDMGLRYMLRKHNLEDKRDYTLVEAQFPSMRAMLDERKVDLVSVVPPFAYDPKLAEISRVLFRMNEGLGTTQMIIQASRAGFLDKNRTALYDFFEDMVRALRWFQAPANRDEAIRIIADFTKQPPENFSSWIFTKGDYYRDPWARPNLEAFQRNIEAQRQLGFLPEGLEVKKYADLSFIEEAARRIRQP